MFGKLTLLLVVTSFSVGCHLSAGSPSSEVAKKIAKVEVNQSGGEKAPLPLGSKLTIVNFFNSFSTGCPTGNRFETMERLSLSLPTGTRMLLVFSEQQFSIQDLENFKAILPLSDSLVQADIESVRSQLIEEKLLVVLDSKGRVIWREEPHKSEPQVFSEVSTLIHSTGE